MVMIRKLFPKLRSKIGKTKAMHNFLKIFESKEPRNQKKIERKKHEILAKLCKGE